MNDDTQKLVSAKEQAEQNHRAALSALMSRPTKENIAKVDSATNELYAAQDAHRGYLKSKIQKIAERLGLI